MPVLHLHAAVALVPLPQGKLLIKCPGRQLTLAGPILPDLISQAARGGVPIDLARLEPQEINTVNRLVKLGVLLDQLPEPSGEALVDSLSWTTRAANSGPAKTESPTILFADQSSKFLADKISRLLKQAGCRTVITGDVEETWDAPLLIYCTIADFDGAADPVNRLCVRKGLPLLPSLANVDTVRVGPLVIPDETACLACVERRRAANILHVAEYESSLAHPQSRYSEVAAQIASGMTASIALRWLHHADRVGAYDEILELNPMTLASKTRPVLRLPRCPVCRPSPERPPQAAWLLEPQDG